MQEPTLLLQPKRIKTNRTTRIGGFFALEFTTKPKPPGAVTLADIRLPLKVDNGILRAWE
jgi:hypothetical protein